LITAKALTAGHSIRLACKGLQRRQHWIKRTAHQLHADQRALPGSHAYALAGQAGEALAPLGITVVSGCGSPATRVAAERAILANGLVLSIVPPDQMPPPDWAATVVLPCGMGDARNLLMALAGAACIVIVGGRAGTKSAIHLAWLHKRPLLPLVGCGGWSDGPPSIPPDERKNSPILPWRAIAKLEANLRQLGLVKDPA
jgi:uncharacterized protein (TIGR00725 family)